jgi:hypothetical protein
MDGPLLRARFFIADACTKSAIDRALHRRRFFARGGGLRMTMDYLRDADPETRHAASLRAEF